MSFDETIIYLKHKQQQSSLNDAFKNLYQEQWKTFVHILRVSDPKWCNQSIYIF